MKRLVFLLAMLGNPAAAAVDPCLVGQWVLSQADFGQMWQQMMGPVQVERMTINGSSQIGADGRVQTQFQDGYGRFSSSGVAFEGFFQGWFVGQISTEAGQVRSEVLDAAFESRIHMVMPNGQNPLMQQMQSGPENLGQKVNVHNYTCTGTQLVLQSPNGERTPFDVWIRP